MRALWRRITGHPESPREPVEHTQESRLDSLDPKIEKTRQILRPYLTDPTQENLMTALSQLDSKETNLHKLLTQYHIHTTEPNFVFEKTIDTDSQPAPTLLEKQTASTEKRKLLTTAQPIETPVLPKRTSEKQAKQLVQYNTE